MGKLSGSTEKMSGALRQKCQETNDTKLGNHQTILPSLKKKPFEQTNPKNRTPYVWLDVLEVQVKTIKKYRKNCRWNQRLINGIKFFWHDLRQKLHIY